MTDTEDLYDEDAPTRDRVLSFGVQIETETYQRNGVWQKDYHVTITDPGGLEENRVFPTSTSAELWIGDRIIANAVAIDKANRAR